MFRKQPILILIVLLLSVQQVRAWGFWAHQRINRLAVFTLPPEMLRFYKKNIEYLTIHAVDPDKRRYAVDGEAERHFIDVDHYGEYPFDNVPRPWKEAVNTLSEDTLHAYGIVPWTIQNFWYDLVRAFKKKDAQRILKISADLGHYVADGNVPLHTTENYNGQMTGQKGIHGLWESRLPELFGGDFNYFIGKAYFINNALDEAWKGVMEAHVCLDSVLGFEKQLSVSMASDQKYSYENRNNILTKVYSKDFCQAYHDMLAGQVERRIRASIIRVGSFWFSAWVEAGQPNLNDLMDVEFEPDVIEYERKLKIKDREAQGLSMNDPVDTYEMLFGSCCGHRSSDAHHNHHQMEQELAWFPDPNFTARIDFLCLN